MKKILLALLVSFFATSQSFAEIAVTNSYSIIKTALKNAGPDSLVLFDIEDVLYAAEDENYNLSHPVRKKLIKQYEKKLGAQEAKKLWSVMYKARKVKYMDNTVEEIFADLKLRQVPSMALTKCFTGKFGNIEKGEDWRINELKALNIDFSVLSPIKGSIEFTDIISRNGKPSSAPMLKGGIIFTARAEKGPIFERVLTHYNFYPKKIIFIDDKLKNLLSVEEVAKKYNIEFSGYVISAVKPSLTKEIDIKKEERRFETLEKENKWITN